MSSLAKSQKYLRPTRVSECQAVGKCRNYFCANVGLRLKNSLKNERKIDKSDDGDRLRQVYLCFACLLWISAKFDYLWLHTYTPTQLFGSGDHMRGQTQIAWETRLTESHDGLGGPSLKTSWLWLWEAYAHPSLNWFPWSVVKFMIFLSFSALSRNFHYAEKFESARKAEYNF